MDDPSEWQVAQTQSYLPLLIHPSLPYSSSSSVPTPLVCLTHLPRAVAWTTPTPPPRPRQPSYLPVCFLSSFDHPVRFAHPPPSLASHPSATHPFSLSLPPSQSWPSLPKPGRCPPTWCVVRADP